MHVDLWDMAKWRHGQPLEDLLWLQENAPVYWHHEYTKGGPGFWAVTRHSDIKRIEADGRLFSSEPTSHVDDAKLHGPQDGIHKTLIFQDAPGHSRSRIFLGPNLTPKCVRSAEPDIERIVTEVLDDVAELGGCDVASDIGGRLAAFVTADLMGLPRQQIVDLYHIADRINNSSDLTSGAGAEAMNEMGSVANEVYSTAKACPSDSLVSHLVNDQVADRPSDPIQFALDFLLLVDAGSDTTRNIVGAGLEAFFDHPRQRELFQSDLSLAPSVTDEVLRYTTPLTYQRRTTTDHTEIQGQRVAKGQKVVMWYPAGNRDPRVYRNALEFDITRSPNPHLGFGAGRHFCLGAHLAKLELTLVFREIFRRFPDIEPDGPSVWLKDDATIPPDIVGPRSMPVRFTPAAKLIKAKTPATA